MKISIVTISYNQANFIEAAIRSVVEQKGVDLEYIVVDPGSTDGSRDIIKRWDAHISKIIFEKDSGPADGLNRGLSEATGEFFYYLNADDMLLPGALAEAVNILASKPKLDVVYGNGWMIDRDGRRLKRLVSSRRVSTKLLARNLSTIIQQASFIRTDALRNIGGFNVNNRTSWDAEAFLAIARRGGRFRRIWRDWGLFRMHGESISGSGRVQLQYQKDRDRFFEEAFGYHHSSFDRLKSRLLRPILLLDDMRGTAAKAQNRLKLVFATRPVL